MMKSHILFGLVSVVSVVNGQLLPALGSTGLVNAGNTAQTLSQCGSSMSPSLQNTIGGLSQTLSSLGSGSVPSGTPSASIPTPTSVDCSILENLITSLATQLSGLNPTSFISTLAILVLQSIPSRLSELSAPLVGFLTSSTGLLGPQVNSGPLLI